MPDLDGFQLADKLYLTAPESHLVLGGMFGLLLLMELFHRKLWKYRRENLELLYRKEQELIQWESIQEFYQAGREINRMYHDMGSCLDVVYCLLKKEKCGEA